ncbi:hypothetical protein I204_05302 [Kwoniella mangroviensis CBS 8886]|uniref:uncharacterized protein n=1 Tax=Kwoniella mangroviensis CBS 8507 TaxID=1296122 RepID=UPI00080D6692|nr:hypothetical protein I204_05302 [Kwoniella mangroviensis CBS 8886]
MCVDYQTSFPSSSRLTLSSTPPTLHFDQSSINDGSISEQETILESPSDSLFHGLPPLPHQRFVNVNNEQYRHRPPSNKKLGKRPVSPTLVTPPLSPTQLPLKKKNKMDMHMAKAGTIAAQSAFQTPLATYVAQMVVWLWYGDFASSAQQPPSSPSSHSPIPNDPFEVTHSSSSRISSLMVHPSADFSKFVSRMLSVTSVSHSVTIIALLYVYRLKMKNKFFSTPGSEQRPFIAGLMLGNKYLDDNTYTNATWAELAGMSLPEINKMETEFLIGLNYQLGVPVEEYTRWKNLLDGFMTSRAPSSAIGRHIRQLPSGKAQYPATTLTTPAIEPTPVSMYRARSASPRALPPAQTGNYVFPPGHEHARKRSAVEAYNHDPTSSAAIYESLRMPTRKAAFTQPLQSTQHLQPTLSAVRARPSPTQQNLGSSTIRSSSLSRQNGRIVSENQGYGRRGSVGHTLPAPLGHIPTQVSPVAMDVPMFSAGPAEWDGGRALLAPYDCQPQPHLVPPEHLMFYSLAAEPHPGVDGAPRKAILRYQEPNQFTYPVQHTSYMSSSYPVHSALATPYAFDDVTMYDANNSPQAPYPSSAYQYPTPGAVPQIQGQGMYQHTAYPTQMGWSPTHVIPEPAQFANAGPPGFTYFPNDIDITNDPSRWKFPPVALASASTAPTNHNQMIGLGLNTNQNSIGINVDGQMVYTPQGMVYSTTTPVDGLINQWSSRSEWSSPLIPRYG